MRIEKIKGLQPFYLIKKSDLKSDFDYSNCNKESTGRAIRKSLTVFLVFTCFWVNDVFSQVSVTATSGTTGPSSYASVSAAFAAINIGTHKGAITIRITGNTTEPGAVTALLGSGGSSSYTSILIQPSGNVTVGGTAASLRGIIELRGADNVTIDGDDPGTAGIRNLTIGFANTSSSGTTCLKIASNSLTGTDGANNNTLKNCILTGSRVLGATGNSQGIYLGNYLNNNATPGISLQTGGSASTNNRIENNEITRCFTGIWANGFSADYPNTGLQIINNVLGNGTSAGNIGGRGIFLSFTSGGSAQTSALIGGNDIQAGDPGTTGYGAAVTGIEFGAGNFGLQIIGNKLHDIYQPSTTTAFGTYGILAASYTGTNTNSNLVIRNNMIYRIAASSWTTSRTDINTNNGVWIGSDLTNLSFDNNTVVLNVANATGTVSNPGSACMNIATGATTIASFRNNILVNTNSSTNALCLFTSTNANISGATMNNNCYWSPNGLIGFYNNTNISTLALWRSTTGKDANGLNVSPTFVSASDMHLAVSGVSFLESGGATISELTTDIDGQTRPGPSGSLNGGAFAYDIGADEFDGIPFATVSITSASATAASCTAISHTVTATVVPGSNPITSVTLTYNFNGGSQTNLSMTNTSGNTWQATIPLANPSNATVNWTVTAVDPSVTRTSSGSYQDNALSGIGLVTIATPSTICAGSTTTLVASPNNSATAATYSTPSAVGIPSVDEDLGTVTITNASTSVTVLNNSSTLNSLIGTIGTATGSAGSYSNFTSFGPYGLTAGTTYNMSLSSLTSASAYENSMAVFIDYNRDGDYFDAGETIYNSPFNTLGAHTESTSFTVPSTAFNGTTRMLIVCKQGTISGPTDTITYGEREEYMLNITSSNSGGGGSIPVLGYSWSRGATNVGNGASVTTAVASTGSYTVTATSVAGCSMTATVTVTTTVAPSTPTATNSSQCGPGIPSARVTSTSGQSSPIFNWYSASTGGTPIQSGTSFTFGNSISTTTTFYVSEAGSICESPRIAVTATVSTAPSITTSGSTTICSGKSTVMTVSSSNAGYRYTWSNSVGTGSSVTVSPTSTTDYTVSALDTTTGGANSGCVSSENLTITVLSSPANTTITSTPTPASICQGGSVVLNASGGTMDVVTAQTGFGTNSASNPSTSYPAPFSNFDWGAKHQILLTQSELSAQGITNGTIINAFYLGITAVGTTTDLENFTLWMKNTSTSQ
ncbi:MAG: beta strand repeat-containing protein, partial [Bacteroidota bacterium]